MQIMKRKAEYKEGPEASENFKRLANAVSLQLKPRNKERQPESYRPQKIRQETGLERFLLPRPCRRMVERVCSFARQLGIGQTLPSDLAT